MVAWVDLHNGERMEHEKDGIGEALIETITPENSHPEAFGEVPRMGDEKPNAGMDRQSVLIEAQALVHGPRNDAYGHPLDDYTRTAGMVSAMLAHKLREPLTAEEVGMMMCCVKLSRQQNAVKRDNLVDLAGYAECVQWMLDERARRASESSPGALDGGRR